MLVLLSRGESSAVFWPRVAAALCLGVSVVTTLTVNVPINARTARWQVTDDTSDWEEMRNRWHAFQGVRGTLFGAAFLLLSIPLVAVR